MAQNYGPKIPISGLVLSWNAADINSYPAPNVVSVQAYSVFNGGLRSANYTIQYSDDNSNWTTAFTGVMSNNSSCGIITGTGFGDGSYGRHKYWRYVEGSAVVSHHPRVSRIDLIDVSGKVLNLITYTSDNCSDSGTYIIGTVSADVGGTVIYDTSGNGNNGTLYNGVGFSKSNSGVLVFDGTNDYVRCTTPNLSLSDYTVIGAARYVSITSGYQRIINASGNNWLLGNWGPGSNSYYAEGWVNYPTGYDLNWRIYTGTGNISSDSYGFYINNNLITQNNGGSAGPIGIVLGDYGQAIGSEPSNSQFSFVYVYNRVLTTTEIAQIYNVQRTRFGL